MFVIVALAWRGHSIVLKDIFLIASPSAAPSSSQLLCKIYGDILKTVGMKSNKSSIALNA